MYMDGNENEKQPEHIKQTEKLFFALQRNITQEAQNTIWSVLTLIKTYYSKSTHKEEWDMLARDLQKLISEFVDELSPNSEIRLSALERNAQDLKIKEEKSIPQDKKE